MPNKNGDSHLTHRYIVKYVEKQKIRLNSANFYRKCLEQELKNVEKDCLLERGILQKQARIYCMCEIFMNYLLIHKF